MRMNNGNEQTSSRSGAANLDTRAIGAAAGQVSGITWTTYRHVLPPDAWRAVEVHAQRQRRAA